MRGTRLYCPPFTPMIELLPDMESKHYIIERVHVSSQEAQIARLRGRHLLTEGEYVRLRRKGGWGVVMSDTPFERMSNADMVRQAHGDVLIGGLGIGMTLLPIMQKAAVSSVTVVEISEELSGLVWPHFQGRPGGNKIRIVIDDMLEWFPAQETYDTIWFDIWDDLCVDNLREIAKLHRRWSHRLREDGWMGSWAKEILQRHK